MKIAIRGGHTFSVPGAKAILDETIEDRKVKNSVIKYLKLEGIDVIDVTPDDSYNTVGAELAYGVNKANNLNVDLFISCHFNKAYNHYQGAIGTEVWTYNEDFKEAKDVVSKLSSLGFKCRGVKYSKGLYELRATKMAAIIIEVCFVESVDDVELYRKLGADKIGKAIAEGILGKEISSNNSVENNNSTENNNSAYTNDKIEKEELKELWEKSISGEEVKNLQRELNNQFNTKLNIDGYFGEKTLVACVTVRKGAKGNLTKLIQKRLISKKYSLNIYGADGEFGNVTEKAIMSLQRDNKLLVDGIVGKKTWKALYKK